MVGIFIYFLHNIHDDLLYITFTSLSGVCTSLVFFEKNSLDIAGNMAAIMGTIMTNAFSDPPTVVAISSLRLLYCLNDEYASKPNKIMIK